MLRRRSWALVLVLSGLVQTAVALLPAKADGADQSILTAVEHCILTNKDFPEVCQNLPYYACMGEQLRIAANPALASERCWHQETFVWEAVAETALEELYALLPDEEDEIIRQKVEAIRQARSPSIQGSITAFLGRDDRWERPANVRAVAVSVRNFAIELILGRDRLIDGCAAYRSEGIDKCIF